MKLLGLTIDNYKIFNDFSVDFSDEEGNPKNIIVLAGINGSGKTSLLEYIKKKTENLTFDNQGHIKIKTEFGIDKDSDNSFLLSKIQTLELNNNLNSSIQRYEENIIKSAIPENNSLEPNEQLDTVISYKNAQGKYLFIDKNKENIFIRNIRSLDKKVIYLKTDFYEFKNVNNAIFSYIKQVIFKENKPPQEAYQIIQTILDEIFESFDLRIKFGSIDTSIHENKENFHVFFKNSTTEKIPIEYLSTGEKEIILKAFYLKVFCPKNAIILIDEPEKSLHPKWQQLILEVYRDIAHTNNSQFIIATHSPHIISSVDPQNLYLLNINTKDFYKGKVQGKVVGKVTGNVNGRVEGSINNEKHDYIEGHFKNSTFEGKMTGRIEGVFEGIVDGNFEGEINEISTIAIKNMHHFQKHTLGVEPNRILKEIMGVSSLRYGKIEEKINRLIDLLVLDDYDDDETKNLISELENHLGANDPFLIRVSHQIKILERKKNTL